MADAKLVAPEPPKGALRENFEAIAVAALFALFVRTFIAQPYKIPSGSMLENLLIGDHLVVNKVVFGDGADREGSAAFPTAKLRRGDVVIFRPPHADEVDYIKRVIGLPGEELGLVYSPERGGVRVTVNGEPLPESYRRSPEGPVVEEPGAKWVLNCTGEAPETRFPGWAARRITLGPDEYFMMGDNRNDSMDSRFWGTVKAERLRGRAWFVYWSFDSRDLPPEPRTLGERIRLYSRVVLGFFSQTRWARTFHVIR